VPEAIRRLRSPRGADLQSHGVGEPKNARTRPVASSAVRRQSRRGLVAVEHAAEQVEVKGRKSEPSGLATTLL
jgi:hypothetical protein